MKNWHTFLSVVLLLGAVSCGNPAVQDYVPEQLFSYPKEFGEPFYDNPENPWTEAGFELGRKLFYDPILSADSTLSCAGCHKQSHAFSDPGVAISPGIAGTTPGNRNAPSLTNLAWYPHFMHDGGVTHLEIMPFAPIISEHEMAADLFTVVATLQSRADYREAFKRAFDQDSITSQLLFYALAQFHSALISANSTYDQYLRGEENLSAQELEGLAIFESKCANCHVPPFFTDWTHANIGLDSISLDPGRFLVTQDPTDSGAFKVPTLRNIALTYPYMHDGRYPDLESVLDFYSSGVLDLEHVDARLDGPMNFSPAEQEALLAFLQTLTDYTFVANSNFNQP